MLLKILLRLELLKWVGTLEPIRLTTDLGWVKIFLQILIRVDF